MDFSLRNIPEEDYDVDLTLESTNSSFLYGEVEPIDILNIIEKLEPNDKLMLDIGSGCGKIVIYLALGLEIDIDGVELEPNRYQKSLNLLEKYQQENRVTFYNEDFKNVHFGKYDILYSCNLVFNEQDNMILYQKILNEFKGYLLLFWHDECLDKFFIVQYMVKTSWNPQQYIYLYFIK